MPALDGDGRPQVADAPDLRGDERGKREEDDGAGRRPARAPGVVAVELEPAERPAPREDRQQRRRQEQVAPEDRQPGGRQHAERHERDDPGSGGQRGAPAHPPEPEHPADQRPEQHRLAQDLPDPPRDGERHAVEPGDPPQRLGVVARARERVQGIARDDEIRQRPEHRGGRGRGEERGELAHVPAGRIERDPADVGEGEQPRLRAQQPGEAEQPEHGQPRARAPRLDEQGGEHAHEVGQVHVRADPEREDGLAGEDDRRGQQARGTAEPVRAERIGQVPERAEEDQREPDRDALRRVAERGEHDGHGGGERVRRGSDRDPVVGQPAVGEIGPPHQGVGRVVVDEAGPDHEPGEQPAEGGGGEGGGPGHRATTVLGVHPRRD